VNNPTLDSMKVAIGVMACCKESRKPGKVAIVSSTAVSFWK
jgi:hypothetical protein